VGFLAAIGSLGIPSRGLATTPSVTVISPNGGQSWPGESLQTVTWSATDVDGIASIDLFYRDSDSSPWTMIARGLSNSGSFSWGVHHTPTGQARVRGLAVRAAPGGVGGVQVVARPATKAGLPGQGGQVGRCLPRAAGALLLVRRGDQQQVHGAVGGRQGRVAFQDGQPGGRNQCLAKEGHGRRLRVGKWCRWPRRRLKRPAGRWHTR